MPKLTTLLIDPGRRRAALGVLAVTLLAGAALLGAGAWLAASGSAWAAVVLVLAGALLLAGALVVVAKALAEAAGDARLGAARTERLRTDVEALRARTDEGEARIERVEGYGAELDELRARLAARTARIERRLLEIEAEIERIDEVASAAESRAARASTDASRAVARALEAREESGALAEAVERNGALLAGESFTGNARRLSGAAIGRIEREWATALGLTLARREARYLERLLREVEGVCDGRIAGHAEDAIVRALAARGAAADGALRLLEVGTLFGAGAAFIHRACRPHVGQVRMTIIDRLDGYYGAGEPDPLTGLPVDERTVRENLRRAGVAEDDVELIVSNSRAEDAAERAAALGPYDALIIDGDHGYDGVKTDYERYAPLVRPGGFLVFDDYNSPQWPDIRRFVDGEILGGDSETARPTLVHSAGSTAVLRMPGGGPEPRGREIQAGDERAASV